MSDCLRLQRLLSFLFTLFEQFGLLSDCCSSSTSDDVSTYLPRDNLDCRPTAFVLNVCCYVCSRSPRTIVTVVRLPSSSTSVDISMRLPRDSLDCRPTAFVLNARCRVIHTLFARIGTVVRWLSSSTFVDVSAHLPVRQSGLWSDCPRHRCPSVFFSPPLPAIWTIVRFHRSSYVPIGIVSLYLLSNDPDGRPVPPVLLKPDVASFRSLLRTTRLPNGFLPSSFVAHRLSLSRSRSTAASGPSALMVFLINMLSPIPPSPKRIDHSVDRASRANGVGSEEAPRTYVVMVHQAGH